jgi:hypothetical protein
MDLDKDTPEEIFYKWKKINDKWELVKSKRKNISLN